MQATRTRASRTRCTTRRFGCRTRTRPSTRSSTRCSTLASAPLSGPASAAAATTRTASGSSTASRPPPPSKRCYAAPKTVASNQRTDRLHRLLPLASHRLTDSPADRRAFAATGAAHLLSNELSSRMVAITISPSRRFYAIVPLSIDCSIV